MRLLFVHGAGGYVEDRVLADALADQLGARLMMPRLPDEDMSVAAWAGPIARALEDLSADDAVVAHSFGATILLHVLGTAHEPPERATLLAMPDWGPEGWDVADYVLPVQTPGVELTLHHCRDDEVVPFGHLALAAARLPDARIVTHDVGGHQFEGRAADLAARV
ncbi:alpha/beta hydrolase [Ornithinimicrobium sp. F0845]|uniref:alpha/beta fold hydrolase n=1 Tax=Ornithinimicrobium sp. F0845 TaxID=2926412 RepID=UPI001FF368DE|nr:alpha/beta hydrolase [Ornithinimicrobium sp. F0845]MCK0112479.1 alpha/beta hydrolase [Ornithinimicrobium sp. F0845]